MGAKYEFHISRRARDRYHFDESILGSNGRLIVATGGAGRRGGFAAARRLVNQVHKITGRSIPASEIYAAALIEEILHLLIHLCEQQYPGFLKQALEHLHAGLGVKLDETLARFTQEFPPRVVYLGRRTPQEYLDLSANGASNRIVAMEEMFLVSIANQNPALEALREFFDDRLMEGTSYAAAIKRLKEFLARSPPPGRRAEGRAESMLDVLLAPFRASPRSLEGQLQYLLERWRTSLGEDFAQLILRAMDHVREEVMRQPEDAAVRAPQPVPDFQDEPDHERFSADRDWMPALVLVAKSTHVWLEQLSRKYGRWIRTLAEIPNEELDLLAQRGMTGLWLIGVWERSRASERIKQRMGQPDAAASAYSIHDYAVAAELGGWEALGDLRTRAARRGIRLMADMVPNHMGIDSTWVVEHPERFLVLDHSPYPAYSFHTENLSDDPRVAIHLEDHYYDQSDAAVVFLRRDTQTGRQLYIYHGNDGTSYPWNDTAQLDYSQQSVREAVIQTILHVARSFPIIRFDAAMTLAKKHIQRLWFPEPGSGGAIASRAEHGMTRAEFEAAMPKEFWREVVDRVAAEVPDTLLLAEAFWLLEGYFVRTLGMHRVYNSAFMHMLRDEQNADYRQLIKNTLEFDPQILRRYVNFMSNPDEKTAAEQFGSGDKYFGACTLMVTLPGLPMFGHGQVEGLREHYGMEYRAPKLDEQPDEAVIRGHEWSIIPLLRRRALFAGAERFHLFDFFTSAGRVNENVFAYANRRGSERALVLYNNALAAAEGWVRISSAALDKSSGRQVQRSLGEALDLPHTGFAVFTDYTTRLEYIRDCAELWRDGLHVGLAGYQRHVFLDWRIVYGDAWGATCRQLNGAGIAAAAALMEEIRVGSVNPQPNVPTPALDSAVGDRPPAAPRKARAKAPKAKVKTKSPRAGTKNGKGISTKRRVPANSTRRRLGTSSRKPSVSRTSKKSGRKRHASVAAGKTRANGSPRRGGRPSKRRSLSKRATQDN